MLTIVSGDTPDRLPHVRTLFEEYVAALGFHLSFQDVDQELAELPGRYAPPAGRILLALWGGDVAGCVALKRLDDETCEMKRFYVRPGFRGRGIGGALAETVIAEARAIGYWRMRLDTVPQMKAAIAIYESLGFRDAPAYVFNPVPGARYFELTLR